MADKDWKDEPSNVIKRLLKGFNWQMQALMKDEELVALLDYALRELTTEREFVKLVGSEIREDIQDFIRAENAEEPEPFILQEEAEDMFGDGLEDYIDEEDW